VAVALVALVVLSAVGPGLAAAATLNFTADKAPMRYVQEDKVTIAEHDTDDMTKALEYEGDDGEVAELPAEVNSSKVAPIGVPLEKVDVLDYRTFPRVADEDGNSVNWTVGSEWTTSTDGGTMSVSESAPADGVDALTFTATAGASSSANATYSNFTIDTDATKRVGQVGMNVDSLATDAIVTVRFQESDGDYVALEVNGTAAADATTDGVISNATGEGWIEQQRLGHENLSVAGTGDGTLSSIDQVTVHVTDGDATVELFWLDTERKSETELGTHYTDGDDDDPLREETETLTDKDFAGEVRMGSLSELSSLYEGAVLHDKTVRDVRYTAEYVSAEDRSISYSEATDYPSYAEIMEGYYRIHVPAPIDVSHGTLALEVEQRVPESRYITTEYALDTGSKSFENASYTSFSSWGSVGDRIEVSTSVNGGDKVIWHDEILYTSAELDALKSSSMAGGPVGSGGGFLGGIWSFLTSLPGILIGGTVGFLGLRRIFGGS
jgi:hypothetical protein